MEMGQQLRGLFGSKPTHVCSDPGAPSAVGQEEMGEEEQLGSPQGYLCSFFSAEVSGFLST